MLPETGRQAEVGHFCFCFSFFVDLFDALAAAP